MAYRTQPAFIHSGDWDDQTRAHPALNFMELYTKEFIDSRNFGAPFEQWHVNDYSAVKADGNVLTGGKQALDDLLDQVYGAFSANYHEPIHVVCYETHQGWEMVGQATLYVDLLVPGNKAVPDRSGKSWDASVPAAFHFYYVKDASAKYGVLMQKVKLYSDSLILVQLMRQRGMIKM